MKQQNKNVYKFKTQKVFDLLKNETFGTLLTDDQMAQLTKEELDDYVVYRIQVHRGLHND